MPLITSVEVKDLLQISVRTYDELIDTLLPIVRDFVVYDLLQNTFKKRDVYIHSNTISFVPADKKIQDSASQFLLNKFTSGIDIIVEGSLSNDGLYEVKLAEAGALTLDFKNHVGGVLITEAAFESVRITRIQYPPGLKIPVSQLFQHLISKDQLKGVQSESLGDYAVTYLDDLPKTLTSKFQKYKRLSW